MSSVSKTHNLLRANHEINSQQEIYIISILLFCNTFSAKCEEKDTSWWNDVIMANLTLPLLHGQKVKISGCRARKHIFLGENIVTCSDGKLEPDLKCTKAGKLNDIRIVLQELHYGIYGIS